MAKGIDLVKDKDRLAKIEKNIMAGLKDFQQATVNRIAELYMGGQRRVLVCDEVGLGKTLIARGTVAKIAKLHLNKRIRLFKVVYLCSNATIADQNIQKLRITNEVMTEDISSSRLSMQHLKIFSQENDLLRQKYDPESLDRYIQLIPLTPDTSFRVTNGAGTVDERALMFAILKRLDLFRNCTKELEDVMKDWANSSWKKWCRDYYENKVKACDRDSNKEYIKYMISKIDDQINNSNDDTECINALYELCQNIKKNRENFVHKDDTITKIIGKIRMIFAKISLEKLEPDLVIMDEFQRFKYLINSDQRSDIRMLTDKFFNSNNVKILLLSATPYKMYSTPEEIDETRINEHYEDFFYLMNFLNEKAEDQQKFRSIWENYSIALKQMTVGDTTILKAKDIAENAMYQTVCRTERISEPNNGDIIDSSNCEQPLEVLEKDILSYVQAQKLLDDIGANYHVPVDYIKSAPYLMSFMKDYKIKKNIENYFKKNPGDIKKMKKDTFWLNKKEIDKYKGIPNNNARLEKIMSEVLPKKTDLEKLLWIPPSRPYYELQGVYKNSELTSKTLIFSSWEMVPRMLACLISYEAERRTVGELAKKCQDENVHYFYTEEKKRYPPARMNFSVKKDPSTGKNILAGMSLFCLIYPSQFLSECYNPIQCMNEKLGIDAIEKQIKAKISEKLSAYQSKETGRSDKKWYYLAPLLLDGEEYALSWINSFNKLIDSDSDNKLVDSGDNKDKNKRNDLFIKHLKNIKDLFCETLSKNATNLGRKPNHLADILTDMAIAGPAICINRTYKMYLNDLDHSWTFPVYMPTQLAKVFIDRMNSPESTAAVDLACRRKSKKSDDIHWQNMLTYCKYGNLQAVFDEYAHLIASGQEHDKNLINKIHRQMLGAIKIRTASYNVDTFESFKLRVSQNEIGEKKAISFRTHFAVAFTKGDGNDSDGDRKKIIREAFNSPFRPFVLATTSVGQEGLDFHNYCRKIVHWNLPSNPIDLEQREGRINRFKCLAIRQNIAKRYGDISFNNDIWEEMFAEASNKEKLAGSSDLIPYWVLRETEDMVKIERIVPMYPYSRDGQAYTRLIKILSMYRLTLGQPRQEELLQYLFSNCDDHDKLKELFINLSPFYKK